VNCSIEVGARGSPLSRAQLDEVLHELLQYNAKVTFHPIWVETRGDKDQKTSLRTLERSDFFTHEIDTLQLARGCRIAIHSAKDLPDPLPKGLTLVALTRGVDPSDALVLRDHQTLENLPLKAKIGTSSLRREKNILELRPDLISVDIRGDIHTRLALLDQGIVDGVVVAEAALIRLKLTHRTHIPLCGERAPLQGQLAVVAGQGDEEMCQLFRCIDRREV
jgi:hydroxymethylbilane synthase